MSYYGRGSMWLGWHIIVRSQWATNVKTDFTNYRNGPYHVSRYVQNRALYWPSRRRKNCQTSALLSAPKSSCARLLARLKCEPSSTLRKSLKKRYAYKTATCKLCYVRRCTQAMPYRVVFIIFCISLKLRLAFDVQLLTDNKTSD